MRVSIGGRRYELHQKRLESVLSAPAGSARDRGVQTGHPGRAHRRAPKLRSNLEDVYSQLARLRAQIATEPLLRRRHTGNRRRLEILGAVESIVDTLAEGFEGANFGPGPAFGPSLEKCRSRMPIDAWRTFSSMTSTSPRSTFESASAPMVECAHWPSSVRPRIARTCSTPRSLVER